LEWGTGEMEETKPLVALFTGNSRGKQVMEKEAGK
jgi:hypothetical protein